MYSEKMSYGNPPPRWSGPNSRPLYGLIRVLLIFVTILVADGGREAAAWDHSDDLRDRSAERGEDAPADGPAIRDPFFEFVVAVVESDSLGTWSRDDLLAYVAASGRETKLPIERVVTLSRLPDGLSDRRVVRLALDTALEMPLPYSILGYHPGTLHVSRVVATTEIDLHDALLRLPGARGQPVKFWAAGVRAMVVSEGHVVLDVDGLVDRLLGKKLDDTWMQGFVLARVANSPDPEDDGLNGLALGLSRKRRPLSGSFDFRHDKVLPNGRPVAKALTHYCRRTVDLPEEDAWGWTP